MTIDEAIAACLHARRGGTPGTLAEIFVGAVAGIAVAAWVRDVVDAAAVHEAWAEADRILGAKYVTTLRWWP